MTTNALTPTNSVHQAVQVNKKKITIKMVVSEIIKYFLLLIVQRHILKKCIWLLY